MKITSLTDVDSVRDYLNRIGAKAVSLKSAVIRQNVGKYSLDAVTIRFMEDGQIKVYNNENAELDADDISPTPEEQARIKADFANIKFPHPKLIARITNPPKQIAECSPENLFIFNDAATGLIKFVQVRGLDENGEKHYYPWTYFDDNIWRPVEPAYKRPLFNADKLKNASVVFIHEGAKAARVMQDMIEQKSLADKKRLLDHPWGMELSAGVHIGWIGGAPNPHRVDWEPLKAAGVKRVYIVADNDLDGRKAVPKIARELHIPGFTVQFTDEWPASFDLADEFPPNLFGTINGEKFYKGPSFREVVHPATWATEVIPTGKQGRPTYRLRESFKSQWSFVEEVEQYVCNDMPEIMRNESVLNKMLASFSDVAETTRLMNREYHGRNAKLAYQPGQEGRLVTFKSSSAVNLHVPSQIKAKPGDIRPFTEFMEYMFPNERERYEMYRWCATLIARPDIRIGYGILLVSVKQGVGKTTLASYILAPLVGVHNVSYPSETDINGQFNGWVAYKRLAVVNEIYSGHSWKAYNTLKNIITDKDVDVNQKYMRQFSIENWCHVFACSNSERALKMENDDRRWFYPKVTETIWPKQKFNDLYLWLQSGGLSIIKHWAEGWNDYVSPSDHAPSTLRKIELIEASRSEMQQEAAALAEMLKDLETPGCLLMKEVVLFIRSKLTTRSFDSDLEIRKAMSDVGLITLPNRIKANGRKQYVIANGAMINEITALGDEATEKELNELVRKNIVRPETLYDEGGI